MRASRKVARLLARAEWLRDKVASGGGSPAALDHAKAELAALEWALPILGDLVAREAAQGRDVHQQRREGELLNAAAVALLALREVGAMDEYERLLAAAPKRVQQAVSQRRFGVARVPAAAPR